MTIIQPLKLWGWAVVSLLLPALALAQPTLTTLQPSAAAVGTSITLTGTGFNTTAAQNVVYFGAVPAPVLTATATTLTVAVPAGATSGASVTVTNLGTQRTASSLTSATPLFRVTYAGGALASAAYRRTDVPAGLAVERLAVGDFNRDGRPDVVATARSVGSTSGMRVLLNQGNRAFAAPFSVDANILPLGVAVGDLNGDGNLDIVAANQGSQDVSVVLGNGQGGFATPANYDLAANGTSRVVIADIDSDGRPDVLTLARNKVVTFYNRGAGQLSLSPTELGPPATNGIANSFDVGDFNGDGRLDVAYPDQQAGQIGFTVLLNSPSTVLQPQFVAGASPFPLSDLLAADFNNDGRSDVLALDNSSVRVWLRNAANSGFAAPVTTTIFPPFRTDVALSDLNGDGLLDLLATANGQPVLLLPGTGTGSFGLPAVALANPNGARTLGTGDFDGDGRADFLTGNEFNNGFSLFTYIGSSGPTNPPTLDPIPDRGATTFPATLTVPLTGISGGGGAGQFITVTASASPVLAVPPVIGYTSPGATGTLTLTAAGPATVTVTVSNGQAINSTFSRTFQVRLGLATRGAVATNLGLYPNPSLGGRFWLVAPGLSGRASLLVTDAAGREVHTQPLPGGTAPAEIQLPAPVTAGLYLLRIRSDARTWYGKLLVQR